jgi:peptidoglycan/LPS O-acetylase OafA/YrhL
MSNLRYRPEIDGLRAVAVIPVILFHMGLSWMPGGYIGVDVFFVISGFLITSIIKKELDQGSFSFRDFWARRVRRILPAMVFVTAVTLAVTYVFVYQPNQPAIGEQALASLLSVANIYFLQNAGDYWGASAEGSPFLHAWSLSVEEQFYLFFPVVMYFAFRLRSRWLQACMLSAVVVSFVLFLWGLKNYPQATFYLLPTRVWELGAGCLLAVSLKNRSLKTSNVGFFATAGLSMVVASYLFIDKPSGGIGLAVVGAALIIAFGQVGLCNKLLSHRLAVHIGKISYSLYLWHWPVLALAKPMGLDWPGISDRVLLVLITYLLAFGTYQIIEKPTRRRKGMVPGILVSVALVAGAALVMARTAPQYYDTSQFDNPRWIEYSCEPRWKPHTAETFVNTSIENPHYKADAFSSGEGVRVGNEKIPPEIIVFGDSHGIMWSAAIADIAGELDIPTAFYVIGHYEKPFFSVPLELGSKTRTLTAAEKLEFDRARLRAIEKSNPKLVIIAARWELILEQETTDLLAVLNERNIQVLLIEDPPRLKNVGNMNVMQYLAWKRLLPERPQTDQQLFLPCHTLGENDGARRFVRDLANKYDNVRLLPTYDLYSSGSEAKVTSGRIPLYLDDDHVTTQGAQLALPRIRGKIAEIIGVR